MESSSADGTAFGSRAERLASDRIAQRTYVEHRRNGRCEPRSKIGRTYLEMPLMEQRKLLGAFLTSRRARVKPSDVGLPDGRRRTVGLRREEVASLAGVSVSWYTWLEQGRDIRASSNTLRRVADVLRLDRAELVYLFALASKDPPSFEAGTGLPDGLLTLLHTLDTIPAYVRNTRLDILAWNRAAAELFVDYDALPANERNTLWLLFLHVPYRTLIVDWEQMCRETIETFRAARASARDRMPFDDLANELCARSAEFNEWWLDHDVRSFGEGIKRIRHPELGRVDLSYVAMTPEGRPELALVTYIVRPSTDVRADDATRDRT